MLLLSLMTLAMYLLRNKKNIPNLAATKENNSLISCDHHCTLSLDRKTNLKTVNNSNNINKKFIITTAILINF